MQMGYRDDTRKREPDTTVDDPKTLFILDKMGHDLITIFWKSIIANLGGNGIEISPRTVGTLLVTMIDRACLDYQTMYEERLKESGKPPIRDMDRVLLQGIIEGLKIIDQTKMRQIAESLK